MGPNLEQLTAEIRARVAALGYEVVDVRGGGSGSRMRLQVRMDRAVAEPGHGVSVEDCAAVSRQLERWLDDSGVLGERYVLEVSSPGIERPIRWPEHWARFVGREVHARLPERGRVRATIRAVNVEAGSVTLALATDDVTLPIADVRDATLAVDWERRP
jgi:ribosome maturation factor RimP